jgi:cytoskeleton protein RodZ
MSEQEQTNAPAYGPGARLKAQREALGLSLDHVATQLKLSARQIESIESDHFDQLPGNTFARGFVRNYAKLLQLDPAPLLAQLEGLLPRERVQVALPHLVEENNTFSVGNGGGGGGRVLGVAGFLLAFCAALGAIFWYLQQPPSPELNAAQVASEPQPASEPVVEVASAPTASDVVAAASAPAPVVAVASATPVAAVTPAAVAVPASAPVVAQTATPTPTPAVIGNGELRIVADEDTWVQVVDANGNRLVSNLLTAGTDRSLGGVPPYRIKIGNAPKTRLWLRGQTVDLSQYTKTQVATFELK